MAEKKTSLVRLVNERFLLKKEQEEENRKQQQSCVRYLPKDCISNILVRLPLDSLQRLRFVCKLWYGIVNSPTFINSHLQRSETVLIFLCPARKDISFYSGSTSVSQEKQNVFSVESKLFQLQSVPIFHRPLIEPSRLYHIKYMEIIKGGTSKIEDYSATCLGKIRASCNGLILLDNNLKRGELIIMNPVTRELSPLPRGTLFPSHDESYGFAFCSTASIYKVVHLFRDELRYVSCEILDLGTRSWRVVDGPSFGLFTWFGYEPVFALEALHWVPQVDHNEYIMSMALDNEKFQKISLPKNGRMYDRIIEINGFLGFATHDEMHHIEVWTLRSLSGASWTKQYKIEVGCKSHMVALHCSRINRSMIFKDKEGRLYAYDFSLQVMAKVETPKGCFPVHGCYIPHVNSIISWQTQVKDQTWMTD